MQIHMSNICRQNIDYTLACNKFHKIRYVSQALQTLTEIKCQITLKFNKTAA